MTEIVKTDPTTTALAAPSAEQANPARVYVASLGTKGGRRVMWQSLDKIARMISNGDMDAGTLPWYALRFSHVAAIRARLAEDLAPATVNRMLSALRGTLRAAWRLGQMDAEDYHRAIDVRPVKGETIPAGRALDASELGALMATCADDKTPAGVRDAAMLGVLYVGGLRRAEVAGLDLADYDASTGELRVMGKGHKERIAWLAGGAALALADWLGIRGDAAGPLFWAIGKGGDLRPGRLSSQAVYVLCRKRGNAAGLDTFTPHDLRRTFVGDLLDAGADIATVQKMAGHASPTTTARYDRRPEATKRDAARLLTMPYVRRE